MNSVRLTFSFQKDSFAILYAPADDKNENHLASYHTLSSMVMPCEKMDLSTKYREKALF